ncbi:succinyl-diaminopimelate desuccinylase [Jiella sp. MQZ9-1]|uniref:Succinyl-diaminopimelate desuccinylase n=1 Tax=Jiella flava TaxID=2816857 RepID=A0A939JS95_9HYPH|nr:succinyl-diaminopimelate desuccinylase [Jiella flava]MBO0662733.1 succinyl-diaminopimelate desuccinylase [Jiella flava]MCD2471155.1 succinyl-diaminopimelate desuccinylase [Jiella flava]
MSDPILSAGGAAATLDPTDPVALLAALIRCPSVTPDEGGALALLEAVLQSLGFAVDRPVFSQDGTPPVENLFARIGEGGPHLVFAGHTDVVPPGPASDWRADPFSAAIVEGEMIGRGAVDMKGGIAAFAAAYARFAKANGAPRGQVSFLITGDEEGPAVNGTVKLLEWAAARGERFDACIVGEPTNPDRLGEMIKIGRRGSLSCEVNVLGRQGHVAYPHLADNPLRAATAIADALLATPLDSGTTAFQPSHLEITAIETGNPSVNVIPARCSIFFNVRFNDSWSVEGLKQELCDRIAKGAGAERLRPGRPAAGYELIWRERPSECFVTQPGALTDSLRAAVEAVVGRRPDLSTSGGTSDARFIKDYCPVIEFGLVGQTMHMSNERVALADLEGLTEIYEAFIARWFAAHT